MPGQGNKIESLEKKTLEGAVVFIETIIELRVRVGIQICKSFEFTARIRTIITDFNMHDSNLRLVCTGSNGAAFWRGLSRSASNCRVIDTPFSAVISFLSSKVVM